MLSNGSRNSQPLGEMRIPSGGYRVLFLGEEYAGFSLSAGGDEIRLLDPKGEVLCQVTTPAMEADQVTVYQDGIYRISSQASPGFPNTEAGSHAFREGNTGKNLPLVISEVLTQNRCVLPDEQGRYSDVIELHNPYQAPVRLGGWYLSDSETQRHRFHMPDITVQSGEYLLIYCDGENYVGADGSIHANFGLSAGDVLCLTDANGDYSAVAISFPGENTSLAVTEQGAYAPCPASLGFPNTEEGQEAFAQSRMNSHGPLVISEVLLSGAGVPYAGSFRDVVEICNVSNQAVRTDGWYLCDGGDPYACPLPEKELQPGEYLVMECKGFGLSQGEQLRLIGPDHRHGTLIACDAQPGMSLALVDDAYIGALPSLGYGNHEEGQAAFAKPPEGLVLSEVMTDNRSYLMGSRGTTCDWVELYNGSKKTVQLSDYYLSDRPDALQAYRLPDMELAPGKYCVIFLAEQTKYLLKNYPVLPFALSAQADRLYLSDGVQVTDYLQIPPLPSDTAWGRSAGSTGRLAKPTPGKANRDVVVYADMPQAVTPQGAYNDVEYVDVILQGEGEIYYTTNCDDPNTRDKRYTGPIRLTKTTVIRAVCVEEGKRPSQSLDLTYLINENDTLAVVSLVTAPKNLFSASTGIYSVNFKEDWEREASISLFETDGSGFTSRCGIKMYGAASRWQPKKSMAVFFRNVYGAPQLQYPLFGEEGVDTYESFVLRAGGQDFYRTKFRDELITSMAAEYTDVAVQKYRPAALYLNGKYWGLYFIREKINEHFVAANYNVSPESAILTERNGNSSKEYRQLVTYATTHNLARQEYYDEICTMMDVPQYIDYIIAQIYIGNSDNSNVRFFTYEGGKWTWILYDTDLGMINARYNSVFEHLNPAGTAASDYISTALLNALLKNPDFKDQFLRRMAWQLNTVWTEENVVAHMNAMVEEIGPDIQKELDRWDGTRSQWEGYLRRMEKFAKVRNKYLVGYVKEYFELSNAKLRQYGFVLE